MKLLLDRAPDIDAADGDGTTALLVAIQSKQPEAAHLLIERPPTSTSRTNSATSRYRSRPGWAR